MSLLVFVDELYSARVCQNHYELWLRQIHQNTKYYVLDRIHMTEPHQRKHVLDYSGQGRPNVNFPN